MSGIDRYDHILFYNSNPRKTNKWYKKVMFHLLDIAMYNSYNLYKKGFYDIINYYREVVKKLNGLPPTITHEKSIGWKNYKRQKHKFKEKLIQKRRYPFHIVDFLLSNNHKI